MKKIISRFLLAGIFSLLLSACGSLPTQGNNDPAALPPVRVLVPSHLKNVTLLDAFSPAFFASNGQTVVFEEATSKQMIEQAILGQVDILIDNSRSSEKELSVINLISDKKTFMSDDFILVGPAGDPAGVKGLAIDIAFRQVAERSALFYSARKWYGNNAENALWKSMGSPNENQPWFQVIDGQMDAVLLQASQFGAYILVDRYTFLRNKGNPVLEIMIEGDSALRNPYHVFLLDPAKIPNGNSVAAQDFYDFLSSESAQLIIKTFGVDTLGQQIFFPRVSTN